jgi:DNA-directed RNA polymerase subunit RPC12/RpoP
MTKPHSVAWESPFQKAVVLGTLLGDSSLSRPRKAINYHLACYHSEKQLDWLLMKHSWLGQLARPIQLCRYLDKRDGKTRSGGRFHTISAPILTELARLLYPEGRKVVTAEYLALIEHPVTLATLIGDDGSWDKAGVEIATKHFTEAENVALSATLNDVFGLHSGMRSNGVGKRHYFHLRIPAGDIPLLRSLCLNYLPSSLHYKLGGIDYVARQSGWVAYTCSTCGASFEAWRHQKRRYCSKECRYAALLTSPPRLLHGRYSKSA